MNIFELGSLKIFFKNAFSIFSTKFLILIISFFSSVLLTRLVTPQVKGLYSISTALSGTFVQFLFLGLPAAHTYFIAKKETDENAVVGNSLFVSFFSFIFVLLSFFVLVLLNRTSNLSFLQLLLTLFTVPFLIFKLFSYNFCVSISKITINNIIDFLESFFFFVEILIFVYFFQYKNADILIAFCILNSFIICALYLFYYVFILKVKPNISFSLLKNSIPIALGSYICCLLSFLILRVDIFMVSNLLGMAAVGFYSTAVNLIDILYIISSSVGCILFSSAAKINENEKRYIFTLKIIGFVFVLLFFIIIFAFIVSSYFIPRLYGAEYINSIVPFKILLPGMLFWSIEGLLGNHFAAEKSYIIIIISYSISLIMNVLLNLLLIPVYGIEGAAISSSISYFCSFAFVFCYFLFRLYKIKQGVVVKC